MLREGKTIELKSKYVDSINKTIIAFANTDGGKLYIGIADDGRVIGVDDVDGTILQITNTMRDTIVPDVTIFSETFIENMEEKEVVVVEVQRGTRKSYYLKDKGIKPESVYLRQGAATVPATRSQIIKMIREEGANYEDEKSLNQDLTFNYSEKYFQKLNVPFEDTQKKNLGLIDIDGSYTNLGLLLSDQCPFIIKFAAFQGKEKTIFKDRKEIEGCVFQQMDTLYDYIDLHNSLAATFEGLYRIDKQSYPIEAVREMIFNTIIHREYAESNIATLASVFDDRLEILNYGGLKETVDLEDIYAGVSAPRNPKLANIFYKLHLVEAFGMGIRKINECYIDFDKKPLIEVTNNVFKMTIYNKNYKEDLQDKYQYKFNNSSSLVEESIMPYTATDEREDKFLKLMENNKQYKRSDVEKILEISQASAVLLLRDLLRKGKIIKIGNGKNTRYLKG